MEYRTLWGGVSVTLTLRLYPERVETKKGVSQFIVAAFAWLTARAGRHFEATFPLIYTVPGRTIKGAVMSQ